MTANRVGILGGSFNPVHWGHLHIAQRSLDLFGLSHIHFVVASTPPHKPPGDMIPFAHRYAMVSLATAGLEHFVPSPIELEPPASPYSAVTLAKLALRAGAGGSDLFFIAGGDSLLDVAGWYSSESLLVSYNFVFVMRPGTEVPDVQAALPPAALVRLVDCRGLGSTELRHRISDALSVSECRLFVVDAGAPDIAASQIRRLASLGQRIDHLLPAPVYDYILKLHLYGE